MFQTPASRISGSKDKYLLTSSGRASSVGAKEGSVNADDSLARSLSA